MDHKSIRTTACYYTITADRKRKAIQTVGEYVTDRHGKAAPLTQSARYQVQSVAVPFGIAAAVFAGDEVAGLPGVAGAV